MHARDAECASGSARLELLLWLSVKQFPMKPAFNAGFVSEYANLMQFNDLNKELKQ
jgi:hypothetical protein